MSNMSFERGGEKTVKSSTSTTSSNSSTPPPTQSSTSTTAVETDPALDAPTTTSDPMIHTQYPVRNPMPHQYYPIAAPPQPLPVQQPAPDAMHLTRPHAAATHQQSNARGNGEDEDDDVEEDNEYVAAADDSHHSRRGAVVNESTELDEEARRRSIAYASHMPSAYPIPFQSGQHDPRLVASQAGVMSNSSALPPSNATTSTPSTYINGNIMDLNDTAGAGPSSENAVPTGNKRKRDSNNAATTTNSTVPGPYPKMRLANSGSKIKVKTGGSKAAAIEALAVAEAATQAAIDSQVQQAPRSQASGSAHGSGGEEGDDVEGGGDESPTIEMNGGVIPEGAQEINPDGSITVHGMRLPPIMQVEKQHVTTTATQAASASRRRNEAQFHCPVPGCGSTFTRRFNLRGETSHSILEARHLTLTLCLRSSAVAY